LLNLFIAVLLENYELANTLEENGITEDDYEMFHNCWEKYDPYATQFIPFNQLSAFIGELDPPFGIPKPNERTVASLNIPVTNDGYMVHCADVLHATAKYAVGEIDEDNEYHEMQAKLDMQILKLYPIRKEYQMVTSSAQRRKQELAITKIQKCLKKYIVKKAIDQNEDYKLK
jgi:hypothetical protein